MDQCKSKEGSYLAIVISIIPLWAILTSLIVFVLLALHKNFRATKIYDNCNRHTAQHVYHIELRTGDMSQTYNKRRTTLTIDMFDENQNTLARIAIPGHVIFGRRDSPVGIIDDDKFPELRVTRLWLYRSTRLKRVSTIRLTHTGSEPDSRIMVYGLELRSDEQERPVLFFPIMSYITTYGCASKPNASFDIEPNGTIGAMGGSSSDVSPLTDQLTLVDYSFVVYAFCSFVFYASTFEILPDTKTTTVAASYKGAIIGLACFLGACLFGATLRYFVKRMFSRAIGLGCWAAFYYCTLLLALVVFTGVWIYTTVIAYQRICQEHYYQWLTSLGVAGVEGLVLMLLCAIISWTIQLVNPSHTEQYIIHDDYGEPASRRQQADPDGGGGGQPSRSLKSSQHRASMAANTLAIRAQQQQQQPQAAAPISQFLAPDPHSTYQSTWQPAPAGQVDGHSNYFGYSKDQQPPAPQAYGGGGGGGHYALPTQAPPATSGNVFGVQKTFQTAYTGAPPYEANGMPSNQYYAPGGGRPSTPSQPQANHMLQNQMRQSVQTHAPRQHQQQQQQQQKPQKEPDYQQQTTKGFKKIGSNESTGSSYYHQIMKNKGGVKSISQYGELLKQKKASKR